jgi:uncharacterized protein YyaL (SSP411 family)
MWALAYAAVLIVAFAPAVPAAREGHPMSTDTALAPRNRLAGEASPYLQQHAGDPVHWYPWCEAAFAEARRLDRPILLSVGYASCHWCHVMARESFADPATAAAVNEGFVAIKVDREERPDIDGLYQQALQLLRRGNGGWPLTVFLSPQGVPFYGGTYFPREASGGQIALRDVLASVSTVWTERRADLARQDEALIAALSAALPQPTGAPLDPSVQEQAIQQLAVAFDARNGGFGGAPKFPHPTDLDFLLQLDSDIGTPSPRTMSRCVTSPKAVCSTSSAAASSATASIRPGTSRTSKRCCATAPCCCRSTPMPGGRAAKRCSGARPNSPWTGHCAKC